jgi:hypothetical protein
VVVRWWWDELLCSLQNPGSRSVEFTDSHSESFKARVMTGESVKGLPCTRPENIFSTLPKKLPS